MSDKCYGFIGVGAMGSVLADALAGTPNRRILLANRTRSKADDLADALRQKYATEQIRSVDNLTAAAQADYLFLGVKPQMMQGLLAELAAPLRSRKTLPILVSMAAGLSIETLTKMLGFPCPTVRIMPNTPASVGAGIILYHASDSVSAEELDELVESMRPLGTLHNLPENLFDAATAITGCGPAFVDLMIEALSDGGVRAGLPRGTAIDFALQMMFGSAKLALETGTHPAILKDTVCSPAGSTIEGVAVLERAGFRAALADAVVAACQRSIEIGKNS